MDRRIIIQQRIFAKDPAGGKTESWGYDRKAWAEHVQQSGDEALIAQADKASETIQFRIRATRNPITPGEFRVLYRMRFFNIKSVLEEGRGDRLLLTCESIQAIP